MNDEKVIFIKGDISGIQEFIFNITSKGAAKSLKSRSFLIEAICKFAILKISSVFITTKVLYNGGGNFYLAIDKDWNEELFVRLKTDIYRALIEEQFSLSLVHLECNKIDFDSIYNENLEQINKLSGKEKLSLLKSLPTNDINTFFEPFDDIKKSDKKDAFSVYANLTSHITRNPTYNISQSEKFHKLTIADNKIYFLDLKMEFGNSYKESCRIDKHIPIWNDKLAKTYINDFDEVPTIGNIVEFESLSKFAKQRTGTDKLGVLKLDIDNLGLIFKNISQKEKNIYLSEQLTYFFDKVLNDLLGNHFNTEIRNTVNNKENKVTEYIDWENKKVKIESYKLKQLSSIFSENLYVVFSGGDDCFIIGAWDAIIEFSILLNSRFKKFQQEIKIQEKCSIPYPITLSASILIIDPHFPVVKFAELAEQLLHKAKNSPSNIVIGNNEISFPIKNKISFLGKIFSWEDFEEVVHVRLKMEMMIKKYGESRAFLQRIMDSFENNDTLYWKHFNKSFDPALLWRFIYHFRDIKNKEYFKCYYNEIFFASLINPNNDDLYKKYILNPFENSSEISNVFPVAARWTDFLTRKY